MVARGRIGSGLDGRRKGFLMTYRFESEVGDVQFVPPVVAFVVGATRQVWFA
jgi:hypothetical protein